MQELTVQVDGHVVRLQPGESATIGRGRDCDITIVDVDVARASPEVVDSSVRVVTMAWPPAERTASTVVVPTTSSPAVMGRWCTNRCSPWTTRLKSMPASGSVT